jgi:16S rRNA (uracil1498-N3)-methyltransferase
MQFFCDNLELGRIELKDAEAHHIAHVLRMAPGEQIELFDGKGKSALGKIHGLNKSTVSVDIEKLTKHNPRTTGRVILAVSIAKGERFDTLVEKSVEIGVDRICPAIFERTVKLAKGTNVLDRFNKIALAASKQCYRDFLPEIDAPMPLADVLENCRKEFPASTFLFGSTQPGATSILTTVETGQDYIAVIGPEGGFTQAETEFLINQGANPVKLTNTVLRIETAAITFAGILCTLRDSRNTVQD